MYVTLFVLVFKIFLYDILCVSLETRGNRAAMAVGEYSQHRCSTLQSVRSLLKGRRKILKQHFNLI